MDFVDLHGISGRPGSRLARLLGDGLATVAPLRGASGGFRRVVADVTAGEAELEAARRSLPRGAAQAEAAAVRLRAHGAVVRWGRPVQVAGIWALLRLCRERGDSSLEQTRADRELAIGMQLGGWFDASWRMRLIRRMRLPPGLLIPFAMLSSRWLEVVADLSFWAGVRAGARPEEWRAMTASSYSVLVYHRFAGELKPGQERIDISPRRFAWQLRALRLAGYRPLSPSELLDFHAGAAPLPRRRLLITVDDAIADCVDPLLRHSSWSPQLFVPTAEVGGCASWLDGEPVAGWEALRGLAAAGVPVGSHGRHHRRMSGLAPDARSEELANSLADLKREIEHPLPVVAFPNGDHDAELCAEARICGYAAAFTTEKGRNGIGTDPHCLKRVSIHGADGVLAVLWKAATGEALPQFWLRLRRLWVR